jgi:hypothetical protein
MNVGMTPEDLIAFPITILGELGLQLSKKRLPNKNKGLAHGDLYLRTLRLSSQRGRSIWKPTLTVKFEAEQRGSLAHLAEFETKQFYLRTGLYESTP